MGQDRIIDPYWMDILDLIEGIELEINTHGFVRDYGIYEETDDSDSEDLDATAGQNANQLPLNTAQNEPEPSETVPESDDAMPGSDGNTLEKVHLIIL